ncbi:HAMP domain-containing sensor histidine kinase [Aeromicrobium sp. Root236]|uniref:sensor histidine kinase n=1 Tax=Aeromicrobium sp. Root236 TaxID=1736498 RepID=UPI000A904809|nr:HAMP domain-containing sensor histidine kinase [Aeromicrobium sp. Root236]
MTVMHVRRLLPQRITLRARLTLIYGGLFFAAGIVLLGSTYALFHQQISSGGSVRFASLGPGESPPTIGKGTTVTANGDTLTGGDAEKFLVSERSRIENAATTSLITQGGIALAIVGGVAVGFGWLIAGRTLAPLRQVTETARRIAAAPVAERGLHERIALRGPDDEVKDLADTFDTMVERLDRSFAGQRRFVANASHELRTPLTLSRAMVEVAMHRKSASPDLVQLGDDLLEINGRHERLITGLLLLASSENEVIQQAPVDLADVVEHVVADTAREADATGVVVTEDLDETVVSGDALLLERLVQNLVENGIRHNVAADGWVRVTTRMGNDATVHLEVSNTGPDVPPYDIPMLFEPFRRLDNDRLATAKGAGLGLSIVRSVAAAHQGDVVAEPRQGGGLVVRVTLPAATDA